MEKPLLLCCLTKTNNTELNNHQLPLQIAKAPSIVKFTMEMIKSQAIGWMGYYKVKLRFNTTMEIISEGGSKKVTKHKDSWFSKIMELMKVSSLTSNSKAVVFWDLKIKQSAKLGPMAMLKKTASSNIKTGDFIMAQSNNSKSMATDTYTFQMIPNSLGNLWIIWLKDTESSMKKEFSKVKDCGKTVS